MMMMPWKRIVLPRSNIVESLVKKSNILLVVTWIWELNPLIPGPTAKGRRENRFQEVLTLIHLILLPYHY